MIIENKITKFKTIAFMFEQIPNLKVLLRIVKGYINVNFLGKNQIRFVELFVTLACNARCEFCSNGLFTKKQGTISLEKYLNIIDECAELNVPVICLIGGEPLLYKNLTVLIKRINVHGIISMLATNGSLLTEKKVKVLADNGLSIIIVSLHSLDEKKHDTIMKINGAYKQIFKAREYCKKYGIKFHLASVVSHNDFIDGTFDRLVEFAIKEKIPLSINPLIPTGYAYDKEELLLTYEDIKRLNNISKKSKYISTHLTNNLFGFGCPAGNSYLGVNATGEIFPCFFIPLSLGDVHNMTLRAAWKKACESPIFAKRHKMCYAGVSREFLHNYMKPIFKYKEIPLPIEKHPLYNKYLPDLKEADVKKAVEYNLRKSNPKK